MDSVYPSTSTLKNYPQIQMCTQVYLKYQLVSIGTLNAPICTVGPVAGALNSCSEPSDSIVWFGKLDLLDHHELALLKHSTYDMKPSSNKERHFTCQSKCCLPSNLGCYNTNQYGSAFRNFFTFGGLVLSVGANWLSLCQICVCGWREMSGNCSIA